MNTIEEMATHLAREGDASYTEFIKPYEEYLFDPKILSKEILLKLMKISYNKGFTEAINSVASLNRT